MEKSRIEIEQLNLQPFTAFEPEGILLVSGQDPCCANFMTIAWGMFGVMWAKPSVMVMVRSTRCTWELLKENPDFTLNWMPKEWRDAVTLGGAESGRFLDKFEATGLHPAKANAVLSPIIEESVLSIECKISCRAELSPEQFVDQSLLKYYTKDEYHDLFFGEILGATGIDSFRKG